MKTLQIFGDSILKGVMYDAQCRKYRLCRDHKFETLERADFSVLNRSKMGATIDKGLRLLGQNESDINGDTVCLLEYGGNDSDFDWSKISADPTGEFLPNTPEKEFAGQYDLAIDMAREKGARVVLSTLIPIDAEKYLAWISRNLNRENILRWLGDESMLYRWQEYYSHLVEQAALRNGCEILDLRRSFLLDHNYKALLCEDGIHPTQAGHDKIEQELKRFAAC